MAFSEQLKLARLAKGLTQQQVAEKMGISNSTYCGYETGKRQPDVEKIKRLAAILDTTGDFLLETGFTETSDSVAPKRESASIPTDVSPEALNNMVAKVTSLLEAFGMIEPGDDLSDEDTAFVIGLIHTIQTYRNKGKL